MLRPEFATRPQAPTEPTAGPARATAAQGGGGFSALYAEIVAGARDFIDHGSRSAPADAQPLPGLSAEGSAYRSAIGATTEAEASSAEQQAFLETIAPWAQEAGAQLGVSGDIVAAHAALESGWGRKPLRHADGSDTHNLFGIKAGAAWQGRVAQAATTEHEGGAAVRTVEPFRSYDSAAEGFRDYAQMLRANPRYQAALNVGSDARAYAQALARGGYATDPAYADKLARLAGRIQSGR